MVVLLADLLVAWLVVLLAVESADLLVYRLVAKLVDMLVAY